MSTEKSVSAFINVIMMTPGLITLYMPGSDSDFSNSIENNFVEFLLSSAV